MTVTSVGKSSKRKERRGSLHLFFIMSLELRGIGLPQGENLDRVEQSDKSQVHFPWDEKLQKQNGKNKGWRGIELTGKLTLMT